MCTIPALVSLSIFFPATNLFAEINGQGFDLGPRPAELVNELKNSRLKSTLQKCLGKVARSTSFSIAHRGAPKHYPEHTVESYTAAAKMGAGVGECDVTFTGDMQLVCRHSQCDLHTTTDILSRPELANKCTTPFSPAVYDETGKNLLKPAEVKCCTSDLTLDEFLTLKGKRTGHNPGATDPLSYIEAAPDTSHNRVYATVLSHRQSIQLFKKFKMKMAPELKKPLVVMPFKGLYSHEMFARQLLDEYSEAGIDFTVVHPQSFQLDDLHFWLEEDRSFGKNSVYLDGRYSDSSFHSETPSTHRPSMEELKAMGVNYLGSPLWMLLRLDAHNTIIPSVYAQKAKGAGLRIFAWTIERSGPLRSGGGWYYKSIHDAIDNDGDMLKVIDVLARDVGVSGIFSDWPATTTFYANCMGLP